MTSVGYIPENYERKGTLFLRSNHMDYQRPTMVTNWHQVREADPKDYDLKDYPPEKRKLHKSTYNRIGPLTDAMPANTTSSDQMEQVVKLRKDFEMRETRKPMVDSGTFSSINWDRDTGAPERGFGSVLPRHHPDHGKRYLDTTYVVDYQSPFPMVPPKTPPPEKDTSALWKKCHSQFTDTCDYRRHGQNTWTDESGIYVNQEIRKETGANQLTDTIPSRLE